MFTYNSRFCRLNKFILIVFMVLRVHCDSGDTMKRHIHILIIVGAIFQISKVFSCQIDLEQATSHMPATLTKLYTQLNKSTQLHDALINQSINLLNALNDPYSANMHQDYTQMLDVNSYEQRFVHRKIKTIEAYITTIEEMHSSLPENETLNALYNDKKVMLFTSIETRKAHDE